MKRVNPTLMAVAVGVLMVTGASAQDHSQRQENPAMNMDHSQHQQQAPANMQDHSQHQQPAMSEHNMHEMAPSQQEPEVSLPGLPRAGTQEQSGMRLEQFEALALKNNPTLAQAEASIRASQGRQRQAGLWENPVVGYTGEEIRGGSSRGGQQGAFIEQTIPISGRLGLSKQVAQQGVRVAEVAKEEQRVRVLTAVKLAFFRVLAAQELLKTEQAFAKLAEAALQTSKRLQNVGQNDQTEVLQAEIELDQAQVAVAQQENRLKSAWQELAAVVGHPDLPVSSVAGSLDQDLPQVDESALLQRIATESPTVRLSEADIARADAAVQRARREWVPDLQVRAGIQQNRELLEGSGRSVGAQGFAEVGVQLPIFNRNQGGVQSASAQLDRAKQERERVRLELLQRAASLVQEYKNARLTVNRYRDNMVPRAKRSYELMLQRWGQMGVSYPQVLLAQRTLFSLQTGYISALEQMWTNSIALEGFMLTDGLREPSGAQGAIE